MNMKTAIVFFVLGIGEGAILRDWFLCRFGIHFGMEESHKKK